MQPIEARADRGNVRAIPSDTEMDLERWGRRRDLDPAVGEVMARAAEIMGHHTVARGIRDDLARRARVAAVPDDPRPPLRSRAAAGQGPLLAVVAGAGEPNADPDGAWWEDVRRICDRHADAELRRPGRQVLDALRPAARRHLT